MKILFIRGGIDLQLLGIGENAHIGFNEPADVLKSRTHLVNLSDSTVKANSRFLMILMKFQDKLLLWVWVQL